MEGGGYTSLLYLKRLLCTEPRTALKRDTTQLTEGGPDIREYNECWRTEG